MKPQSHEEQKQHTFDSFCKKTIKLTARTYFRSLSRRRKREVSISELSTQDLAKLSAVDRYPSDVFSFCVMGHDIDVSDEQLAEALNSIPADRRDIILLAFFLGMNDREIAEQLNLVRRTVAARRAKTLQDIKKIMEENADE
jgi:DNA-directed RNA polymerase specialized sigma subunit, sigma24 homolog